MNDFFINSILRTTGASSLYEIQVIQSLWSGYGNIIRYGLEGSSVQTVIAKHIQLPKTGKHPRGWNTDISHQRKIKSYQVEAAWYQQWSSKTDFSCRIPKCLGVETFEDEVCIILEDLDAAGFPIRKSSLTQVELENCITWLANFHSKYLGEKPINLWNIGTYWHLDTRPGELVALKDIPLKNAASKIDKILNSSPFQTFVHGDAKLANFCFSESGEVATVDFQYVGGGCGMKDLAYFVGSCLYDEDCEAQEESILTYYFNSLELALKNLDKKIDFSALEKNWRDLYPVAWTDFHRFLKGWSPDHWKINSYSEHLSREVLKNLTK